jgi:hypothetical protein
MTKPDPNNHFCLSSTACFKSPININRYFVVPTQEKLLLARFQFVIWWKFNFIQTSEINPLVSCIWATPVLRSCSILFTQDRTMPATVNRHQKLFQQGTSSELQSGKRKGYWRLLACGMCSATHLYLMAKTNSVCSLRFRHRKSWCSGNLNFWSGATWFH